MHTNKKIGRDYEIAYTTHVYCIICFALAMKNDIKSSINLMLLLPLLIVIIAYGSKLFLKIDLPDIIFIPVFIISFILFLYFIIALKYIENPDRDSAMFKKNLHDNANGASYVSFLIESEETAHLLNLNEDFYPNRKVKINRENVFDIVL